MAFLAPRHATIRDTRLHVTALRCRDTSSQPSPTPPTYSPPTTIPDSNMDDYGLSSSDEAVLTELASAVENRKRSSSHTSLPALKKPKPSAPEYPTTSALARKILAETWGYPAFRLRQEEAISRLIHGGSAVVVFPTGGGKSLVYQVPALAFDEYEMEAGSPTKGGGLTVVVSPLIALMKVCGLVPPPPGGPRAIADPLLFLSAGSSGRSSGERRQGRRPRFFSNPRIRPPYLRSPEAR